MKRIYGLDSVRAVCAIWVVISHLGGPPIPSDIPESSPLGWCLHGLRNNLWNGPAAVIVFFVISGFCIHYPFLQSFQIPSLGEYFTRRYIRIGIPLLIAAWCAPYVGVEMDLFSDSILWSLVAELVYYSLYPLLLGVRRSGVSWQAMWIACFVAALCLAATNPTAKNYPSWGYELNWLLGLPCWVGGCLLAEQVARGKVGSGRHVVSWRIAIWSISVVLSVLRFHSPLGYPWTLNAFSVMVVLWLSEEIGRFASVAPFAWLEWMGRWSYSMYLVHVPAVALFRTLFDMDVSHFNGWFKVLCFVSAVCYCFFVLVEWPSHQLARCISYRLRRVKSGQTQMQTV